jgi:hypothetical protein
MADRSWTRAQLDESAHAALRALPPSSLWSLLLDLLGQHAAQRAPADVQRQFERDGFVQPAPIDQRTLVALDGHLLAAAAGFEAIELSPLAPLGACSTVGPTSQNKIVSALRGTEVLADPTNVLALECARRLRGDASLRVRLATCARCVRAQELPKQPGFAPHFRIFCLVSAGREQADHAVAGAELITHIATHLAAFDRLALHGYAFPDRRLTVLATPARAALADRVAAAVSGMPVERGRWSIPTTTASASDQHAQRRRRQRAAGGRRAFDWLTKLTSNHRLVMIASGMGRSSPPIASEPRITRMTRSV